MRPPYLVIPKDSRTLETLTSTTHHSRAKQKLTFYPLDFTIYLIKLICFKNDSSNLRMKGLLKMKFQVIFFSIRHRDFYSGLNRSIP